tara:strand:- start:4839 stop:6542 length:1704 start_codon:yes stop_codon:yes gene_type:complete
MKKLLLDTFYILKFFKKENIFFLIFLMILVSILELVGISLVIPFVTSIVDPNYLDNSLSIYFKKYFDIEKLSSISDLLIIFILSFYLLKNFFVIYVVSNQWRYSMNLITLVRLEFFKRYLNLSYVDFIKKDHAELISNITNVSANFGSTFIVSLLIFISELLIIISIIIFLFIFNFKLTLSLVLIFSLILLIYYKYISKRLKVAGLKRVESDEKIINYSKLSFQNIKELKLFNKQNYFIGKFLENAKKSEDSNYFYQVSAQYPRIGMEIFAIVGICTLTLLMNYFKFSSLEIITTLAFYGVSIFRILPSANKLMFSFQSIRFSKENLNIILSELKKDQINKDEKTNDEKINFSNSIEIENLKFGYHNQELIIKNLNFKINKGEFIGIKGKSGSGKTTLIDILMGLIEPTSGNIKSDGIKIKKDLHSWRTKCSYVPQNISLINDTISGNIAFGEDKENIDKHKVTKCLSISGLNDFVSKLENKEQTFIGENGLAISGGQRQRLAIARALYRDPDIIFFDESTSALDKDTEREVINSIKSLKGKITIIFISHNQIIYEGCDDVIDLDLN